MAGPSALAFHEAPLVSRKIKWSPDEDEKLISAVSKHGITSWSRIGALVPGRTSKQCRERWLGQLSPGILKSDWTPEEDLQLIRVQAFHGNKWTVIAEALPGRSSLSVKNRWNWLIRHRIPHRFAELPPFIPCREVYRVEDVTEKAAKARPVIFDPLLVHDDLFGDRFREFQAKMLGA
jgi:hypothetical protein